MKTLICNCDYCGIEYSVDIKEGETFSKETKFYCSEDCMDDNFSFKKKETPSINFDKKEFQELLNN